jgi:hypothetical protein
MLEALMNPGSMTQDQWLIVGILFLLFLGILFFVYRTYLVIRESAKSKYTPNIGLSRMENDKPGGSGDAPADKDN